MNKISKFFYNCWPVPSERTSRLTVTIHNVQIPSPSSTSQNANHGLPKNGSSMSISINFKTNMVALHTFPTQNAVLSLSIKPTDIKPKPKCCSMSISSAHKKKLPYVSSENPKQNLLYVQSVNQNQKTALHPCLYVLLYALSQFHNYYNMYINIIASAISYHHTLCNIILCAIGF